MQVSAHDFEKLPYSSISYPIDVYPRRLLSNIFASTGTAKSIFPLKQLPKQRHDTLGLMP